jgi:hypothetical protein
VQKLAEMAQAQELEVAEFLWHLDTTVGHDLVRYRRRLFALTGFTSAHYIPHPVRLAGTRYALIFLAPGFEGTGSDAVVSIRAQTGMRTVMGTSETWQKKPTNDQLVYFVSCLLGGVHGIWVRDLLPAMSDDTRLVRELISCLKPGVEEERERFLSATGLSRERYCSAFGEATAALVRSGLEEFLKRDAAR